MGLNACSDVCTSVACECGHTATNHEICGDEFDAYYGRCLAVKCECRCFNFDETGGGE